METDLIHYSGNGNKLSQKYIELEKQGEENSFENVKSIADRKDIDPKLTEAVFLDDEDKGFDTCKIISQPAPILLDNISPTKIPYSIFPDAIGEMIEATANATETPLELATMFSLATLATSTQKTFQIMPEPKYFSMPFKLDGATTCICLH